MHQSSQYSSPFFTRSPSSSSPSPLPLLTLELKSSPLSHHFLLPRRSGLGQRASRNVNTAPSTPPSSCTFNYNWDDPENAMPPVDPKEYAELTSGLALILNDEIGKENSRLGSTKASVSKGSYDELLGEAAWGRPASKPSRKSASRSSLSRTSSSDNLASLSRPPTTHVSELTMINEHHPLPATPSSRSSSEMDDLMEPEAWPSSLPDTSADDGGLSIFNADIFYTVPPSDSSSIYPKDEFPSPATRDDSPCTETEVDGCFHFSFVYPPSVPNLVQVEKCVW